MYTANDLIWTTNVFHSRGTGWAYSDKQCGNNFMLNWPTAWPATAETPKVDDIILLFQKPNVINGRRNYVVHLTHLVTPVSTTIHEDRNNPQHRWCREVKPIAIANPINSIPNIDYFNFHKPNRGQTHPIENVGNRLGLDVLGTQNLIFDLFSGFFCPRVDIRTPVPQNPFVHPGWIEGDKNLKLHIEFESTVRSGAAARAAKLLALRTGNGRVLCECCKFDFFGRYGKHGEGYIEAHHRVFLSTGERLTRPEDFALVCANCHRMLHRKKDNGEYPSVNEVADFYRINSTRH